MRRRGRFWTKMGRRYINIHVENNLSKMRLIYRTFGTFHLADAAPFYFKQYTLVIQIVGSVTHLTNPFDAVPASHNVFAYPSGYTFVIQTVDSVISTFVCGALILTVWYSAYVAQRFCSCLFTRHYSAANTKKIRCSACIEKRRIAIPYLFYGKKKSG